MANSQNSMQPMPPEHAASLSPSPDLPALLDRLVGLLAAATHDAPMMLFLHEPGANQYLLHHARGLEAAPTAEPRFSLDSDLARWLAAREHPIYLAGSDDQPLPPLDAT
ncbi:MAG: hypothetical protein PVI67_08925, partial [Anaerolineae bacterium]